MKAIKTLLVVIFIITFSCNKQNDTINNLESNFTFEGVINNKIGIEKDGEFTLYVINDDVMNAFRKFSTKNDLNLKPLSFKVITIDNNKYLRFYNDNNQVSTIALIKDDKGFYSTGGTVCTSSACSPGGGCVPNGLYCTPCKPQGQDSPINCDCVRVTSNEN